MLEVFVASTACGFMLRLEARVQLALGFEVLEDRLDDHVGLRDAVAFDVGCQAAPSPRRASLASG